MSNTNSEFGDYLVFADESGDHILRATDKDFPVFCLAFCIIEKSHYCDFILPSFNKLKLKYFQDTTTVFHERDIRKANGSFGFLTNKNIRNEFFRDINDLMTKAEFTVIATVIDKINLQKKYVEPANPYFIANQFCLERLKMFLEQKESFKKTSVVFEARGAAEDKNLELSFLKEVSKEGYKSNFSIRIVSKYSNCSGLQLADLIARPICRHIIDAEQENRTFEIIERKFYVGTKGEYLGCGLKLFP